MAGHKVIPCAVAASGHTGMNPYDWLTGVTACRHACGASILRIFSVIVAVDGAWHGSNV